MKKAILTIALASSFAAAAIFTGCQSKEQKEAAARENVQDAKQELKEAQQDANAEAVKVANAEEWKAFKIDSELRIKNNEIRIAELRVKMNKRGTLLDPIYKKKIETLQEQNRNMTIRIETYEKNQSDWAVFKQEFNHDMDELGQSLKDFTIDNQ